MYVETGDTAFPSESFGAPIEYTNNTSFNIPPVLRENILNSDYYKSLHQFDGLGPMGLLNEIKERVVHTYPYVNPNLRTTPSTFMTIVYKLCSLRFRQGHIQAYLKESNAYIKATGLLALRFVLPADQLFDWFAPYLFCREEVVVAADGTQARSIGEYAEGLLAEERYYGVVLPRMPVKIKNELIAETEPLAEHRQRRKKNLNKLHLFKEGVPVAVLADSRWQEGILLSLEINQTEVEGCEVKLDESSDVISVPLEFTIVLEQKLARLRQDTKQAI